MARIKGAVATRKRRNKILKAAKGYWGSKSKHFKMAKQAVMKSGNYAGSRNRYGFPHNRCLFFPFVLRKGVLRSGYGYDKS